MALAGCAGGSGDGDTTNTGGGSTDATATQSDETEQSDQQSKVGGSLTVAQAGAPPDWDPVKGLGVPSAIVGQNFFSTLYTYNDALELVPDDLAAGLPEPERDGQRWTVEIVDNAKFHNGDPVTAEDVMYSFQAPIDEGSWVASSFNMITDMTAVDETTIQFDLEYTYGAFPGSLGSMQIVPKAVREADVDKFSREEPIGSGPFVLDGWKENEFATIKRWDDYWGESKPNLDEVTFVPIPESTTRVTNFKTGESAIMQDIPPKLFSTVESIQDGRIAETPALSYTYMTFNLKEGETTKPKVREAIDYTFDMDQVVEKFVEPAGVRQYQPIPIPTAKAWDMPINEFEQMAVGKDIDKAKSLFEEADVPGNWSCKILCPPDDVRENMCVTIANGIKEAGYKAQVQRLDWGTFLEKFSTGNKDDFNMYSLGWSVSPDPDYQMYDMYHISGAGANQGHYWNDEEAMQMIEESRKTTDRERRRELYIEIQKMIIEQRVQLPAWNPKGVWAVKDHVEDFQIHAIPSQNPQLFTDEHNIWVDE
ncbi:ABC transporter substrate-binding protein [Halogeometricum sp. CBA1124]|uniref:ABC transporter substrate-binding protein n=1 Tax=Halogeometricum sp. CBA1124 TaxID=2668071 RepID=UPI0018D25824|nr:ABC transporter substrate-binding protein [Halogeometricum sp. CBA1124]